MNDQSLVAKALSKSPRVLFLGQHYLGHESIDPLAVAFAAIAPGATPSQWWIEATEAQEQRAARFLATDRAVEVPADVTQLLRAGWDCVYTSCIDSTTRRQLEIPNQRLVNQITSAAFDRIDNSALTLLRLFGTVERQTTEELPPSDLANLRRRRTEATAMLARLTEIVTPSGRVFVDGWSPLPGRDWLRVRDLGQAFVNLLPEQVLLFGLSEPEVQCLVEDEDFGDLIHQGIVVTFTEPLTDLFHRLIDAGEMSPDIVSLPSTEAVQYRILHWKPEPNPPSIADAKQLATIDIPVLEWRRLTRALTILKDLDPTEVLPMQQEVRYHEFRRFLADDFPSPPWKWLRHFAFRRRVADTLLTEVLRLCSLDTPQDHVVIVHGASGTGKSILLQGLVLDVRQRGLPVVFVGSGAHVSNYSSAIGEFSLLLEQGLADSALAHPGHQESTFEGPASHTAWSRKPVAEDAAEAARPRSGPPVVVIYDGLERDETYISLTKFLASRGRKCLVIGSSFSWQTRSAPARGRSRKGLSGVTFHPFGLPGLMEETEKEGLLSHLAGFIPSADADLAFLLNIPGLTDNYFFAVVYRSLPDARRRLESGILQEIMSGSESIQGEIERSRGENYAGMTLMEVRLRQALQHRQELLVERLKARDAAGAEYESTDAILLLNAVMLASMVAQPMPISLALRLIRNNFRAYAKSVPEDIIVEHEPSPGLLVLAARHQLEADIWVRYRLPGDIDKVQLLKRMVVQIRAGEVNEDRSPELEFVVKLLQAFGPQAPDRFRLSRCYEQLAGIVQELRARYKRVHPRLLLLASHAIRESIQVLQSQGGLAAPKGTEYLEAWSTRLREAEEGLEEAIDLVTTGADRPLRGAPRRMLATLETEAACVLGVQVGSIRRLVDPEELGLPMWQEKLDAYFRRSRAAWLRALRHSEDTFQALDTACWVSDERFQAGGLRGEALVNLLADWSEAIDRYFDGEIPPSQLDRRERRDAEFSRALGSRDRFDAVVRRLGRRDSAAAGALEARFIAMDDGPAAACSFLEERFSEHLLINRALTILYFRLWWQARTGLPSYFPHERVTLRFNHADWTRLRELCEARLKCEGEQENGTTLFLEGCALIHLDRPVEALRVFEHLDRLDIGGFRRARALMLLADQEGSMRLLSGEYRGRKRGSNLLAWCDDLGINIPFNAAEHNFEAREGRVVGPFCVALSFRGPFALPLYRVAHPPPGQ